MLKLINTGLARTGTTSLQVALDLLGFGPSYHMRDVVTSHERLEQWEKIICDGQRADWSAVFDGYTSAVDGPCALYYTEIMEAFPEAKAILTVRDAEDWYQSCHDTLYQFALKTMEHPLPADSIQFRSNQLSNTMTWNGLFGGRFSDKEHAIKVFRDHNDKVISSIDPGKLLVYDVSQGWDPLCAYLGIDVPREPFPHANDGESMRKALRAWAGKPA